MDDNSQTLGTWSTLHWPVELPAGWRASFPSDSVGLVFFGSAGLISELFLQLGLSESDCLFFTLGGRGLVNLVSLRDSVELFLSCLPFKEPPLDEMYQS